jgi:quinoprotein glucose dehydrogenase
LKQYDRYISQGQFIPHALDKVDIMLPGTGGGAEWGGPAIDPASGVLYVNSNEMPRLYSLVEPPPPGSEGQQVYQDNCSSCHGVNRAGAPPEIPSLLGIQTKLSDDDVKQTVRQGKGRMPPFTGINDQQVSSLIQYLKSPPGGRGGRGGGENGPAAVASTTAGADANDQLVYPKDKIRTVGSLYFLDPDGYPAVVPPWGTFSAIDMNTGKYLWKIPFGEYPALAAQGMHDTGSQNYGGPILTASGILFIGASIFDHKFHAIDAKTGKLLWQDTMPFSASATPATYLVNGKQYVVVAAGGTSYCGCPTGGVYVAYTLP